MQREITVTPEFLSEMKDLKDLASEVSKAEGIFKAKMGLLVAKREHLWEVTVPLMAGEDLNGYKLTYHEDRRVITAVPHDEGACDNCGECKGTHQKIGREDLSNLPSEVRALVHALGGKVVVMKGESEHEN